MWWSMHVNRNKVAAILAVMMVPAILVSMPSCTSPCGLKLQQHVFLPASVGGTQRDVLVPCCGGSAYRDVDLSALNDLQVDITNPNVAGSGVDGFLTDVGCEKLFETYAGNPVSPLCTIHLGPVTPRTTSARKSVGKRSYRLFAQAFTSDQSPVSTSLDMGIWSTACKWNPISP